MASDAEDRENDEDLLKPGDVLDERYRIEKELGRGGIGVVYKAEDLENHIPVALKMLRERWAKDRKMVARFLREGRLAIRALHPNIVQVYAINKRQSNGAPYLVMEFIQGDTLLDRFKADQARGVKPGLRYMNLIRQLASVLAACHARGVVHRDLKPSNIMIVADEEAIGGERIKLVDFGIAKMFTDEDQGTQTSIGEQQPGTPAYMAPEQVSGTLDPDADPARMDVYAAGVILYQTLAGRLPLYSPNPMGLMALVLSKEPEPLLKLDPTIPGDLAQLVHEMLDKDPKRRPTMEQVRERLKSRREAVSIRGTAEMDALVPSPITDGGSDGPTADASGKQPEPFAAAPLIAALNKSVGERSTQPQAPEPLDGHSSIGSGTGQQVTGAETKARRRRRRMLGLGIGAATLAIAVSGATSWRMLHAPPPQTTAVAPLLTKPVESSPPPSSTPTVPPSPTVSAAPAPEEKAKVVGESAPHKKSACTPVKPTDACISGTIPDDMKGAFLSALDAADVTLCTGDCTGSSES